MACTKMPIAAPNSCNIWPTSTQTKRSGQRSWFELTYFQCFQCKLSSYISATKANVCLCYGFFTDTFVRKIVSKTWNNSHVWSYSNDYINMWRVKQFYEIGPWRQQNMPAHTSSLFYILTFWEIHTLYALIRSFLKALILIFLMRK